FSARVSSLSLSFHGSDDHRALHSFPTRRSSDLGRPTGSATASSASSAVLSSSGPSPPATTSGQTTFSPPSNSSPQSLRIIDDTPDRKSTRLNSSHVKISYAVFCLKKKKTTRLVG